MRSGDDGAEETHTELIFQASRPSFYLVAAGLFEVIIQLHGS